MKRKDDIWELVAAMTKGERRHFRLHQGRAGGARSHYMKLFGILCLQQVYDETAARAALVKSGFRGQYSVMKGYLYEQLMLSLNIQHRHATREDEIRELLRCAQTLFLKSLYGQCGDRLSEARKLAGRYGATGLIPEISRREQRLRRASADYSGTDIGATFDRRRREARRLQRHLSVTRHYRLLDEEAYAWHIYLNRPREASHLRRLKARLMKRLKDSGGRNLPPEAQRHRLNALFLYAVITDDGEKAHAYGGRLVQHMERHPDRIRWDPVGYINILCNHVLGLIMVGRLDAVPAMLAKARNIERRYGLSLPENGRITAFARSYNLELAMYETNGRFDLGAELEGAVEKGLARYGSKANPASIMHQMARMFFGTGNHRQALRWINRLMQVSGDSPRKDVLLFAPVFNLLIHYEMGHDEYILYLHKSVRRHLQRQGGYYRAEEMLLRHLKRLVQTEGSAGKRRIYRAMKEELTELIKDPFQRTVLDRLDLVAWIDSKLSGLPFAAEVQRQFRELQSPPARYVRQSPP